MSRKQPKSAIIWSTFNLKSRKHLKCFLFVFFHKNASTGNNTGLHFCIYKNINLQFNNSWRQTILMDQLSNMDLVCGQHVCNTNFGPFQHLKSQHKECNVHCKAYNRGNCITKHGEVRRKLTREPQTLILTQWHTRRRKLHFIKRFDLSSSLFFCQIKLHLLNNRTLSCTEWKRSNTLKKNVTFIYSIYFCSVYYLYTFILR